MSATPVRLHRVRAFCDWLETVPAEPPFHTRPEFRFYEDLTDPEVEAAKNELQRRAALHMAEANRLDGARHQRDPGSYPDDPEAA